MKLIYLAHPYGGNDRNIMAAWVLWRKLTDENPNYHIFNAVNYFVGLKDIFTEAGIQRRYTDMVTRCDELWVAPGWEESAGCKAEIAEATKIGMKVRYLAEGTV